MEYKRKLIQINNEVVILLHIFNKKFEHSLEDFELFDIDEVYDDYQSLYKESAKQFIEQFEKQECIAFIKALRDHCNEIIEKDNIKKLKMSKKYENQS